MPPIQRIKTKIRKVEGKDEPIVLDLKKYKSQLRDLIPGDYIVDIYPVPAKLSDMRKVYFSMETELGRYLGYKKPEIHEALKRHIGHDANYEYISIADIKTEADMLERIRELEEFAAREFQFTFPPYNPEQ